VSVLITLAALMFVVAASAQSGPLAVSPGPSGLVFPVSGAPFSAQQVEERTQTAPDGISSTEEMVSQIYRDGAGRMRIEYRFRLPNGDSFRIIDLIDPVARSVVTLLVDSKIADYLVRPHSDSGPFNVGFPAVGRALPEGHWHATTEVLGARMIEGIEVQGSRVLQTSDDQFGLTAVRESWSSPSLRMTLVEEASGPGWKHTAKLENVDRQEPAPDLFVIPPDYTIQGG